MNGAKISGIEYFLPSQVLSSADASKANELPESIRQEKLGINQVHIAATNEPSSFLASQAVEKLCEKQGIEKASIEFLILVTQNPDHYLPTTACIVQESAGLSTNLLAFDINQGCSGYIVGLSQASAMIKSGLYKRGLVVTSEVYNKRITPSDKDTYGLFGDAAAATLVETCTPEEGFVDFSFGTDGSGAGHLIIKNGGSFHAQEGNRDDYLYMNGRAIYNFVTQNLSKHVHAFLDEQKLTTADVDHWIFHQANKFMNSKLCSMLAIPEQKAFFDIRDIGNTVSSSIPIAIKKAQENQVPMGANQIFCGFGVGLSWGSCLYKNLGTV